MSEQVNYTCELVELVGVTPQQEALSLTGEQFSHDEAVEWLEDPDNQEPNEFYCYVDGKLYLINILNKSNDSYFCNKFNLSGGKIGVSASFDTGSTCIEEIIEEVISGEL